MRKKVCVVTGTRAEYGLLRWVMELIRDSNRLELQIVATCMHLSPEFGHTVGEIEADGFRVDRKVEMLLSSDTPVGITKSTGLGLIGMADAFDGLAPDIVLMLGDRFELLAAAAASLIARIPIAHLHGGELTEGAFDDAIRHSITKMAHLHFVAAQEYGNRVIQLGEEPDRVFVVGGLGIDSILRLDLLDRDALEDDLGFRLRKRNLLVTFHPVTLQKGRSARYMQELLDALAPLEETGLIFTMPNADTEGRSLFRLIEGFVAEHPNACAFTNLGQRRYLSCIEHVDGVVGNSSSGLIEVPTFKKGTIDIGDRQKGRLRAESVLHASPDSVSIGNAIERLYSSEFQSRLEHVENPYGTGRASEAIVRVLERTDTTDLTMKSFYDLPRDRDGQATP